MVKSNKVLLQMSIQEQQDYFMTLKREISNLTGAKREELLSKYNKQLKLSLKCNKKAQERQFKA